MECGFQRVGEHHLVSRGVCIHDYEYRWTKVLFFIVIIWLWLRTSCDWWWSSGWVVGNTSGYHSITLPHCLRVICVNTRLLAKSKVHFTPPFLKLSLTVNRFPKSNICTFGGPKVVPFDMIWHHFKWRYSILFLVQDVLSSEWLYLILLLLEYVPQ